MVRLLGRLFVVFILTNAVKSRYINDQKLQDENLKLIRKLLQNLQPSSIQNTKPQEYEYFEYITESPKLIIDYEDRRMDQESSEELRTTNADSQKFVEIHLIRETFDSGSGEMDYINEQITENNKFRSSESTKQSFENAPMKILKFKEKFVIPNEYSNSNDKRIADKYGNKLNNNGLDTDFFDPENSDLNKTESKNYMMYGRQNREQDTDSSDIETSTAVGENSKKDSLETDGFNSNPGNQIIGKSDIDKLNNKDKTIEKNNSDEGDHTNPKSELNAKVFKNNNQINSYIEEYNSDKLPKHRLEGIDVGANYISYLNKKDKNNKEIIQGLGAGDDLLASPALGLDNTKYNKNECGLANIFLVFLNNYDDRNKNINCNEDSSSSDSENDDAICNQGNSASFKLRCKKHKCKISLNNIKRRVTNRQDTTFQENNDIVKYNLGKALGYLEKKLFDYYDNSKYHCEKPVSDNYYDINCQGNSCKYEIILDKENYNKVKKYQNALFKLRCQGDRCELDSENHIAEDNKERYKDHEKLIKDNSVLNEYIKERCSGDKSNKCKYHDEFTSTSPRNLGEKAMAMFEHSNNDDVDILNNVIHDLKLALVNNRPKTYKLQCIGNKCEVESNDHTFVKNVQDYLHSMNTKKLIRTDEKDVKEHKENKKVDKFLDQTRSRPNFGEYYDNDYSINFDHDKGVQKLDNILNDFQTAVVSNMVPKCKGFYCDRNNAGKRYEYQLVCKGSYCEVNSNDRDFLKQVKIHGTGSLYHDYTRGQNKTQTKKPNTRTGVDKPKFKAYHLEAVLALAREAIAHKVIDYIKDPNIKDINNLNLDETIVDRFEVIKDIYQSYPINDNLLHEIVIPELSNVNDYEVIMHNIDNTIYVPEEIYKTQMKLRELVKPNNDHEDYNHEYRDSN